MIAEGLLARSFVGAQGCNLRPLERILAPAGIAVAKLVELILDLFENFIGSAGQIVVLAKQFQEVVDGESGAPIVQVARVIDGLTNVVFRHDDGFGFLKQSCESLTVDHNIARAGMRIELLVHERPESQKDRVVDNVDREIDEADRDHGG